jgi:hypothetical protein
LGLCDYRKERREILNRMKEENDNRMKLIANLEVLYL